MVNEKLPTDSNEERKFLGNIKQFFIVLKEVVKRKSRLLLVLSFFIITTVLSFYYLIPRTKREESVQEEMMEEQSTVFENIGDAPSDEFVEYNKALEEGIDYWKNWNWEDNLVYAHIKEVDKTNTEMTVFINPPDYSYASFGSKSIFVNVKCPKTKTVAITPSHPLGKPNVVGRGFDVFEKAKLGDTLITYCLDEECLSVGKQCILIVRNK
ncbi:hypothetical protein ACFLZK_02085 [Patescibacteria group bacterium]